MDDIPLTFPAVSTVITAVGTAGEAGLPPELVNRNAGSAGIGGGGATDSEPLIVVAGGGGGGGISGTGRGGAANCTTKIAKRTTQHQNQPTAQHSSTK